MSSTPSADQKQDQITESLAVHNIMRSLPADAQNKLRQIALRRRASIMEITREAILTYTQPTVRPYRNASAA